MIIKFNLLSSLISSLFSKLITGKGHAQDLKKKKKRFVGVCTLTLVVSVFKFKAVNLLMLSVVVPTHCSMVVRMYMRICVLA